MKKKIPWNWQKVFFAFLLLSTSIFGSSIRALAQTPLGISLSWDKAVGCQVYSEIRDDKDPSAVFVEDIDNSACIRFCELTDVTYTLANVPSGATTSWNVVGGTINSSNSTSCNITWGAIGAGSFTFTITNGGSIISKTVCVEKVAKPIALFGIAPGGVMPVTYVCPDQTLNFTNLSSANNGTNLVSYLWDFGDGTTSTAFEPSHAYTNTGGHLVTLTVRNECNCTATYEMKVLVKGGKAFSIECPTVVCEGQSAVYSLSADIINECGWVNGWSVVGGQILSQANGQVEILWNNVDQYGFGYVTFDASACGYGCGLPVTVKVPVIQAHGTIQGPTDLCFGEQGRYKLPQWPTTEIQWQLIGGSGQIIQTDQRNEVIVVPFGSGYLTLVANYTNTLLKCSGEALFTIHIGEPVTVNGPSNVCQNSNGLYTTSAAGSVNWTLTTNTGTPVTTQTASTFNYNFSQAGNFILTANKAGFCTSQKTITVIESPSDPTGVIGELFVCPNAPYTYGVLSPDPASNYFWSISPSFGSIIGTDLSDEVNITFNGTFPATVNVVTKTISPIECISDSYPITINQIPIDAEIASPIPFEVCANTVASYTANMPGTSTLHSDGDNYTWSFANSNSSVAAASLGSISNGQGTNAVDIVWNNVTVTTTLDLILTISKCNINTEFTQQITLYPIPEIEVIASSNSVCSGLLYPVTFTVQSTNGVPITGATVDWNVGGITSTGGTSHTTPLSNPTSANVGQMITAVVHTDCGVSNTATVIVTVLPNPPAVATLTSGANAFCTPQQVNATITASTNATGITYQWYHNGGTSIPGATSSALNVTPSNLGAGIYTVRTTNPNTCVSVSNEVSLFVIPCPTGCTVSHTVTNNSYLSGCGEITLVGTHTGPAITDEWLVLGASPLDYSINTVTNVLTGIPGNYKIIHKVTYPCGGGTASVSKIKDVVIPYMPDFSYVVECTGANTFHVDFIDNSNFYTPVMPKNMRFYYKAPGASSFTGPIAYNPATGTGNFELTNLTPGNYVFKQEVDGYSPVGMTCDLEYNVNLQGINPMLDIIHTSIPCHNTPVQFELFPSAPGLTAFWDFDDAGAQNTMDAPSRVFTLPDHTYNVTCEVTNQFGCSKLLTEPVYIPKECFFGDIVSSPSPAEVCQGETVTLTYVPNGDNCAATSYTWMNGNTPVAPSSSTNSLVVTTTGFYWVKVQNAAGCEYASPTQIKPLFKTLPNLKLIGESTFCEDAEILFSAVTNASNIKWYISAALYAQFNDMTEADFTGLLPVGNYTVTVEATSAEGCVNAVSLDFSVVGAIHDVTFDVQYQCNPYQVIIKAIPDPNVSGITYNWSNGASTQIITVSDGGPYQVTASLGGCSYTEQIDIPKNPEDYMWIFPTGCFTGCEKAEDFAAAYLVGPTLPLPYWSWNQNQAPDQQGGGTFPTPYTLTQQAEYSTTLNTGPCELESGTLDYTVQPCEPCDIKWVKVLKVYESIGDGHPYCSYTYVLEIYNASSYNLSITIYDIYNNVLIIPSSFTLVSGSNIINLTSVIPQSPFTGGTTTWMINGTATVDGKVINCTFKLDIEVPECEGDYKIGQIAADGEKRNNSSDVLTISPNPASDLVHLNYDLSSENAEIEIYDISGRSMGKYSLSSAKGELQVTTSTYQSGMYMVVVKQDDAIIWQQKLVIE